MISGENVNVSTYVWTNLPIDGSLPSPGEKLGGEKLIKLSKMKGHYDIFVKEVGESNSSQSNELFLSGKLVFPRSKVTSTTHPNTKAVRTWLTNLEYRILVYFLKQGGSNLHITDLAQNCWKGIPFATNLKSDWELVSQGNKSRLWFSQRINFIRVRISQLNKILRTYLSIQLISYDMCYRMSEVPRYCVQSVSNLPAMDTTYLRHGAQNEETNEYARIWTNSPLNDGDSLEGGGDEILKVAYEKYITAQSSFSIFIIDKGEFQESDEAGTVYSKNEIVAPFEKVKELRPDCEKYDWLTPEQFSILVELIKKGGKPGHVTKIASECLPDADGLLDLLEEWKMLKKHKGRPKKAFDDYAQFVKNHVDRIKKVMARRKIAKYDGEKIKSSQGSKLRWRKWNLELTPVPKYCLLVVDNPDETN